MTFLRQLREVLRGELLLLSRSIGTLVLITVIALAGPTLGTRVFSALEATEEQDPNKNETGERVSLAVALGPELAAWVEPEDHLILVAADREAPEEAPLASASAGADGEVEILYSGENKRSKWARGRIRKVVKRRNRQVADAAWAERGHELPRAFARSVRAVRRRPVGFKVSSGFSDLHHFVGAGRTAAIGYGVEGQRTHGTDERVRLRDVVQVARVYADFMLRGMPACDGS